MGTCSTKNPFETSAYISVEFRNVSSFTALYNPTNYYFFQSPSLNVFRAHDAVSKFPVVIKSVTKSSPGTNKLFTEILCLKKLSSPNIIKLRDYFQTEENFYVVYNDDNAQSLLDYFQNQEKPLTIVEMKDLLLQLLKAISYLHKNKIVHTKLDYSTIYYSQSKVVSLGGFGNAIDIGLMKPKNDILKGFKPTMPVGFQSPEVISQTCSYKSDVWSLGIVYYTLITAELPFKGTSKKDIINAIKTMPIDKQVLQKAGAESSLIELIEVMLTKEMQQRPSAEELLKHPYFSSALVTLDRNTSQKSFNSLAKFARSSKVVQLVRKSFANRALSKGDYHKNLALFNKIDGNHDGVITFDEFKELHRKAGSTISDEQLNDLFKQIDQSNNGLIEYEEFAPAFFTLSKDKLRDKAQVMFYEMDENKDGQISFEEIRRFLGQDENLEKEMQLLETKFQGRNAISFDEFKKVIEKFDG